MCRTRGILRTLCEKGDLDKAIDLLGCLDTSLSTPTYVSIFKACCQHHALSAVKRLQLHLLHRRIPLAGALRDHLVLALARCGAVEDARLASDSRSVFCWTALVSAYADRGSPAQALCMHRRMLEHGVVPNNYTYVALFKACGAIPDLASGRRIHADALKMGLSSDAFACNTLVSMYGKCGSAFDAQSVFESMTERTIVSWNAMLAVFVEESHGRKALEVFAQMYHDQVGADEATYVASIQACAILAEHEGCVPEQSSKQLSLEIGKALHAETKRGGISSNAFVGSALVSMYSKCGAVVEAEHAFGALLHPGVVPWNAMISAYVEQDEGEEALQLYLCFVDSSLVPDETTYVAVLQACASLAEKEEALETNGPNSLCLQIGEALHAEIVSKGFESVVFIGNTLVVMYGKCLAIAEAEQVFCSFEGTIMSWNAMLSVYIDQGVAVNAFRLYMQMREESNPDERTVVMVLLACMLLSENEELLLVEGQSMKVMSLEIARAVHADVCRNGLHCDVFVGSALINLYGTCGDIDLADHVFGGMTYRDLPLWNSMLSACVEQNLGEKALLLYGQMLNDGVMPDERTFVVLLQACGNVADKEDSEGVLIKEMALSIGQALHTDARKHGVSADIYVGNSLIGMYVKCGSITDAEAVFGLLSQRDIVSWNEMVSAYVDLGQDDNALRLHRQMEKHLITHVTLTRVLQACDATASLDYCWHVHFEVLSTGYDQNPSVAATLVSAYGGCFSMLDAESVFAGISEPDLTTWNASITGHAGDGDFLVSFRASESMGLLGTVPDSVAFIKIVSACARAGLVDEGLWYFESMNLDHDISPDAKHYGCLLDLFGRTGDFTKIEWLLDNLPVQTDVLFWLGLLGACTRGNVELGERAFRHVMSLQPEQSSPYILMSNIYADAGFKAGAQELERAKQELSVSSSGDG